MYCEYYGMTAKPFQLSPEPGLFYGSKNHKRAMAYLEYGLHQGEGFVVITGEIGSGKTTLVGTLFRKLKSEKVVAARISNTNLDPDETLRLVVGAFGMPYADGSKSVLLKRLELFLRQAQQQGKRALLVVDEAQNLSVDTVEELRMLSNFQVNDHPLLQIFLLGQPEFRRTLMCAEMEQLRQRVIAAFHLDRLDSSETRRYIEHRLNACNWSGNPGFSDAAHAEIYDYSRGIPRKINTLCDRVLLMGFLENMTDFDREDIQKVIAEIEQEFMLGDVAQERGRHAHAAGSVSVVPT